MFEATVSKITGVAQNKRNLLNKNAGAYWGLSLLAGAMIGFGSIMMVTVAQKLPEDLYPWRQFLIAAAFSVALELVVMAGAELFTGNVLLVGMGAREGGISWKDAFRLWGVNWAGNFIGSILLVWLYFATGTVNATGEAYLAAVGTAKCSAGFLELFCRGMLCNALVCLCIWCAQHLQNEVAKIIMIFLCIFTFVSAGFEHSVANMSFLTMALHSGGISFANECYNIVVVTLGNFLGAFLFTVWPYALAANDKK